MPGACTVTSCTSFTCDAGLHHAAELYHARPDASVWPQMLYHGLRRDFGGRGGGGGRFGGGERGALQYLVHRCNHRLTLAILSQHHIVAVRLVRSRCWSPSVYYCSAMGADRGLGIVYPAFANPRPHDCLAEWVAWLANGRRAAAHGSPVVGPGVRDAPDALRERGAAHHAEHRGEPRPACQGALPALLRPDAGARTSPWTRPTWPTGCIIRPEGPGRPLLTGPSDKPTSTSVQRGQRGQCDYI